MLAGVLVQRFIQPFVIAVCALLAVASPCATGPPFLTDDPVPVVDFARHKFYVFGTLDHANETRRNVVRDSS